MNYKYFLDSLFDIKNISYDFPLTKSQKNLFKLKNYDNEIINNLAFSPIKKEEKIKILNLMRSKKVNIIHLTKIIEEKYNYFFNLYSNKEILLENYMNYFYEWMEISTNNNIDRIVIENIQKNIRTNNSLFWFYLIKKIYTSEFYQESYNLIQYKKYFFNENNELYETITLYELISIRESKDYLNNPKWLNELCLFAKKLHNFEVLKITTLLECNLLNHQKEFFIDNLNKYQSLISSWRIIDILNIYELAIYMESDEIILKIKKILILKDIKEYIDLYEYEIYQFLNDVYNDKNIDIIYYQRKLKTFNFKHYFWYRGDKCIKMN